MTNEPRDVDFERLLELTLRASREPDDTGVVLPNDATAEDRVALDLGAAVAEDRSLEILRRLAQNSVLTADQLTEMAVGYDDWRSVFLVVRCGWAGDSRRGLALTRAGREAADVIFRRAA